MRPAHVRGDQHGATAVEFALTMPLFLLIMLGIIQAGWLLWTQYGLQQGVQMAARCATNQSVDLQQ
jgi:Flp pilus assembly protein TadG